MERSDMMVGLAVMAGLVWQWPNIQAKQASQAASVAEAQAQMKVQDKLAANQMSMAESAKLAEKRYANGVEMVSTIAMDQAAPIQEGKPVIAGAWAKSIQRGARITPSMYLGRGITVGDAYGNTAVLKFNPELGYAVAEDFAITSNRAVMAKAMEQRPGMKRPGIGLLGQ